MPKDISHVLAADIGGTSSRFALFAAGENLTLLEQVKLVTSGFDNFRDLIGEALSGLGAPSLQGAVLAVAGPVEGDRFCRPPNIGYIMDLDDLPSDYLPKRTVMINDFAAQAHGCRLFWEDRSVAVTPGRMNVSLTQAVIGPGTGLGKTALVPDGRGGYALCASEGGHAAFPFNGPEEHRFQEFALEVLEEPYVRWESVVSGSGLALVHQFLTGEKLTPADVAAGLTPESPTAEWFARFLGRACRDYVLEVLARGGLFISGGVVAKNHLLLIHPAFMKEFLSSATHADLLARVPIRLVTDQQVALWGAASHSVSLLKRSAQKHR
jgi:glucokinase